MTKRIQFWKESKTKKESKRKKESKDTKVESKLAKLRQQEKKIKGAAFGRESGKAGGERTGIEDMDIRTGDMVRLYEQDTVGEVIDINKDNVMVAFGNMIITVKAMKLKKAGKDESRKARKTGKISGSSSFDIGERKLKFKPEIDVRGKRADEALDIVSRFIDDAVMVAVRELRILHGKGDGILKNIIRDYLNSLDIVKSCKDEHVERGGAGITVVILDL